MQRACEEGQRTTCERQFSGLAFDHVDLRDGTGVTELGGKCLYLPEAPHQTRHPLSENESPPSWKCWLIRTCSVTGPSGTPHAQLQSGWERAGREPVRWLGAGWPSG